MTSQVYFLPWDKRDKLEGLLTHASFGDILTPGEYVAVKTHFGERGNTGYIKPPFFKPIIGMVKRKKCRPFLTDTNTIYHGPRNNAIGHLEVAFEHGFLFSELKSPIIIADGIHGNDYRETEIKGKHFKKVKIASAIAQVKTLIAVSHFKGHLMVGFGGAIKNLGMGCGARIGKFEMHSGVAPTIDIEKCIGCEACVKVCAQNALKVVNGKITLDINKCAGCGECIIACGQHALSVTWSESGSRVQEKFAEYALGAIQNKNVFCITFVNNISPNCDCLSKTEPFIAPDIGILASTDPVAIDQAALDLVLKTARSDVFKKAHPTVDHDAQLRHAEHIGLGNRNYKFVKL
jgi:uncharacterized Fe-S center protein